MPSCRWVTAAGEVEERRPVNRRPAAGGDVQTARADPGQHPAPLPSRGPLCQIREILIMRVCLHRVRRAKEASPKQLFALVKADAGIDIWSIRCQSLCQDIVTQSSASQRKQLRW